MTNSLFILEIPISLVCICIYRNPLSPWMQFSYILDYSIASSAFISSMNDYMELCDVYAGPLF